LGGWTIGNVNGNATFLFGGVGQGRQADDNYRTQLQRIAPPRLFGRERELQELADFCLRDDQGPYVWWQAGPWAGKSALMSTFVLNPPAELTGRVWFVSFFVTAQLANQNTRDDFVPVLSEQLCAFTQQDVPHHMDSALREQHMLGLLSQAAAACRKAGGRLVLLVDGLDEDRQDSHSIAALLPQDPPAGMRIIVAGRPNPPVPDDVGPWHPLRDPAIVRRLVDSPHARDLQRLSKVELKRLIRDGGLAKIVVGLLTAARGALSAVDLRDLTGTSLIEIEDLLHTVAGRTFASRAAAWSPGDGPEAYLLGHEQLDAIAAHYLGEQALARHRERLHAWAADQRPDWPATTTDYLLRSYPRLLREVGDAKRLVDLVTDQHWLDRLLQRTGGDEAAFAELTIAHDFLANQPESDLLGMGRLSIAVYDVRRRNTMIPVGMPAVWATLGYPDRAEALALGFTIVHRRGFALAALAEAIARQGDLQRAERLLILSEQVVRSLSSLQWRAEGLAAVMGALVRMARAEAAERLANEVVQMATAFGTGDRLVTTVVTTLSGAGQADTAIRVAGRIPELRRRVSALAAATRAAARVGDLEQAGRVAAEADMVANRIENAYGRSKALTEVALSMTEAGQLERPEEIARRSDIFPDRAHILASMALCAARAGQHARAAQLADEAVRFLNPPDPLLASEPIQVLATLAEAMAYVGRTDRSTELFAEAERLAARTSVPLGLRTGEAAESAGRAGRHDLAQRLAQMAFLPDRPDVFVALARTAVHADDPMRAVQLTADTADHDAELSVRIADVLARAGHTEQATQLLGQVELRSRSVRDRNWEDVMLCDVARSVARSGDPNRAESLARAIHDSGWRAGALAAVTKALAESGNREQAERLFAQAEETARGTESSYRKFAALAELAGVAAETGQMDRAATIAGDIDLPTFRAQALESIAAAGDGRMVAEIEEIATAATEPDLRADILTILARALVPAGESERAERVAREIQKAGQRIRALAGVAKKMAESGLSERAGALALDAERLLPLLAEPDPRARASVDVAEALAWAGEANRAEKLAREIPHDSPFERAHALMTIAEAVGLPEANRLLAEVFALGRWALAIIALATLRPELVVPIANAAYGESDATAGGSGTYAGTQVTGA
jgi:tetratricopeptide (TPR) repeat protein